MTVRISVTLEITPKRSFATAEFGAPARISDLDRRTVTADEGSRLARPIGAAWVFLDETVLAAPESLRKGPRGGGRDPRADRGRDPRADRRHEAPFLHDALPSGRSRRTGLQAGPGASLRRRGGSGDGSPARMTLGRADEARRPAEASRTDRRARQVQEFIGR